MARPTIPIAAWPRDAVWMADKWWPISGPVSYQNLALFSRKVTIGDHNKDSDDLISTWITLRDTTGGTGILDITEGTDDGRFWFGTLWSRDFGLLTLNRETVEVAGTYPLGDLTLAGVRTFFYADGTNLMQWDETADTGSDTTVDLSGTPVNVGERFQGTSGTPQLYIPLGADGIDAWDGTTITHITTDAGSNPITCLAVARWAGRLVALGQEGELWTSVDGSTFDRKASTVDGAYRPRNLVVYFNRNGDRTLCVTTDERLLEWDVVNDVLVETEVTMPPHPAGGLGVANWRDTLYQSAGMMVYFYNGGSTGEVGPTRNDGIPATYRGTIVDLYAEHNALYALVQGTSESGDDPDFVSEDVFDDDGVAVFSPTHAYSSLWAYTNIGWHVAWVSDAAGGTPTRIYVSAAQDGYRLWWGANGTLHTQALPKDFHNPRAGLAAGVDRFAPSGFIETGWFDAAMAGFRKLASHIEVGTERAGDGQTIQVLYQRDFDTGWLPVGDPITSAGVHVVSLGGIVRDDGTGFSEGVSFDRIRFRVEMTSDSHDDAPLMTYFGLYFIKIPRESGSWTFTVPTFAEKGFMGGTYGWESGLEIKQALDDLLEDEKFIEFGYLGEIKRVKVAGVPRGQDDTGTNFSEGLRVVNLVECKLSPSRLGGA